MPNNHRQLGSKNGLHRLVSSQLGFSLVEELVALGLVSLGLVLLVAMITTGSIGVTTMGDKTTADSLARSQLELIKASAYKPDPTSDPYPNVSATAPYSLTTTIEYWDAANEVFISAVRNDGMQRISVTVSRDSDDLLTLQDLKVAR